MPIQHPAGFAPYGGGGGGAFNTRAY